MQEFAKKNYFIFFVLFSGIPLFFLPNVWDGLIFDYGLITENLSGIKTFYQEIGSPFQLFFFYLIFFIKKITFIPHEFLFDLFTIIVLILFSYEIKKYSTILFGLDNKWSNLCAIFAITCPLWDSLIAINLGLYLFCFYLALLGYRLFISKNLYIKIIGVIIILFSFSIKSNISFIFGLCLAHNLRLYLNKETVKKYSLLFIFFLSAFSYLIDINFFPPHGYFEDYNKIKIENLNFFNLAKNIYNYLTFFIFYLWIPIFYLLILRFKGKKIKFFNLFKKEDVINYLTIIIIFAASIAPYVLVNKSSDLFYFTEYTDRHAFLLPVSFGLFFTILFKKINDVSRVKKIHLLILILFLLQNLSILSIAYYTKIESAFFRYDFVEKLKKIEKLPGGNVQIISSHMPGYLRHYEVSYYFFKAYGQASWWGKVIRDGKIKENLKPDEIILKGDNYKTEFILDDYNQRCEIVMQLTNEIDKFDRIFKFYIFNFRDYFKIKVLKVSC